MAFKVFFAHSKADIAWAQSLKEQCEARGIDLYLYEDDPQYGRPLEEKIEREIQNSVLMLALLTPKNCTSGFLHEEIGKARLLKKLVIAMVHPDVPLEQLAYLQGDERLIYDPENFDYSAGQVLRYLSDKQAERQAKSEKEQQELVQGLLALALIVVILYTMRS